MANFKRNFSVKGGSLIIETDGEFMNFLIDVGGNSTAVSIPKNQCEEVSRAFTWASYAADRGGITEAENELSNEQLEAINKRDYDIPKGVQPF